jgi:hypothetical protein
MSNRLSIEVATTKWRSQPESQQSITVFDDFETVDVSYEKEVPADPVEILKLVCKLEMDEGWQNFTELLDFHIVEADDNDGISIEGDWIELNDPRISEIVKAYRDGNREFFGLEDDKNNSKPIESTYKFSIGDSVIVPDPDNKDLWVNEFVGTIKDFSSGNIAVIEDQDGDCWDIEINRLKKAEN